MVANVTKFEVEKNWLKYSIFCDLIVAIWKIRVFELYRRNSIFVTRENVIKFAVVRNNCYICKSNPKKHLI